MKGSNDKREKKNEVSGVVTCANINRRVYRHNRVVSGAVVVMPNEVQVVRVLLSKVASVGS